MFTIESVLESIERINSEKHRCTACSGDTYYRDGDIYAFYLLDPSTLEEDQYSFTVKTKCNTCGHIGKFEFLKFH